MPEPLDPDFSHFIADAIDRSREDLVRGWVDAISSRLGMRSRRALPSSELSDQMPRVLVGIATCLRGQGARGGVAPAAHDEMTRIARLRYRQGCGVEEVLGEIEILGTVVEEALSGWVEHFPRRPQPAALLHVSGQVHRFLQRMATIAAAVLREEERAGRARDDKLLHDFADVLIHQLKTPLGAAEGAALLLENEEMAGEPEERRRFAAIVQRNLHRARNAVDDVRRIALSRGASAPAGRQASLRQVLDDVLQELREHAAARGVHLHVDGPPPDVLVDASRVELVLVNLVGNAIKYSDPTKSERWVRIGFQRREGTSEWWVYIRDNGLGIPGELHERVFERFFRGHPDAAEGLGLGLPIVREALEQVGSRIELRSDPGAGSAFRFPLPSPGSDDSP
jgi:signal transduction histidine kinase